MMAEYRNSRRCQIRHQLSPASKKMDEQQTMNEDGSGFSWEASINNNSTLAFNSINRSIAQTDAKHGFN